MKAAVVVFPGSNCDRDMAVALRAATGAAPAMVWHQETALPDGVDLVALPGGFSFGDYLRCGAIAARAPIMAAVGAHVRRGGAALGVCNGWQLLIEAGLLPGALLRNRDGRFVCRMADVRVEAASVFTDGYSVGDRLRIPVAHHDGNFVADEALLDRLEGENRVAFRYLAESGAAASPGGPGDLNGSARAIAGVLSENRRVLGMMPHPERATEAALGSADGAALFAALAAAAAPAV